MTLLQSGRDLINHSLSFLKTGFSQHDAGRERGVSEVADENDRER